MRDRYLVYPEAIDKLQKAGLVDRVAAAKKSEEGLPYIGSEPDYFAADRIKNLAESGMYKHIPKSFMPVFYKVIDGICHDDNTAAWTIQKHSGLYHELKLFGEKIPIFRCEPCKYDDLRLFFGDIASLILKPDEMWDHERLGFDSPSELVGTLSAYLWRVSNDTSYRDGLKWISSRDGSNIETEITGDMNADLRIFQTDVTEYPTIDPFGFPISIRPVCHSDKKLVAAYHSTEGTLFTGVLKWIDQMKLESECLKDNAKEFLEWGRSLGQGGGSCAEHFGGHDGHPSLFFTYCMNPIPQLDEEGKTDQRSFLHLTRYSDDTYALYIDHKGNLVVSGDPDEDVKSIDALFTPADVDDLLKGILFQCARGLGRTSAKQILSLVHYMFSDDFKKDKERWKKEFNLET